MQNNQSQQESQYNPSPIALCDGCGVLKYCTVTSGDGTGICLTCLQEHQIKNPVRLPYRIQTHIDVVPPLENQKEPMTLVNRFISHRKENNQAIIKDLNNPKTCTALGLSVFKETVKVLRDKETAFTHTRNSYGTRGEINSFTPASRRRLKHVASNFKESLISQFCLTYHEKLHKGSTVKRHLDSFLKCMRRKYPTFKYLWIFEFQSRGMPHYHLYYNLHHKTPGLRRFMARSWHRITGEKTIEHLTWHLHKNNNIAWDMGSAQYLTKYLDKEHQKAIPPEFGWSGRFWGSSRGMVAPPQQITDEHFKDLVFQFVNRTTGELITQDVKKVIIRQLGKLHERRLRQFGRKSRARRTPTDYTISCASKAFWQLWEYYYLTSLEEVPF